MIEDKIISLENKIEEQNKYIKNLEKDISTIFLDNDISFSKYNGWLNSTSFFKRAISVSFYNIIGNIFIFLIIAIPLFFLLMGLFSKGNNNVNYDNYNTNENSFMKIIKNIK